jgi:hypothetical protein
VHASFGWGTSKNGRFHAETDVQTPDVQLLVAICKAKHFCSDVLVQQTRRRSSVLRTDQIARILDCSDPLG